MPRTEYEVKVAYEGDSLVLTHRQDHGPTIIRTYDSETHTATDAVRELIREKYDAEAEFVFSGEIPGGKLYLIVEASPDDEYRPTPTVGA